MALLLQTQAEKVKEDIFNIFKNFEKKFYRKSEKNEVWILAG